MKHLIVKTVKADFARDPAMAELLRKVESPCDLDEALVSLQYEQALRKLTADLNAAGFIFNKQVLLAEIVKQRTPQ